MKICYCGMSSAAPYGAGVVPVSTILEAPDALYDTIVEVEVEGVLGTLGCANMVVIDTTGEAPVVREKNDAEILVDRKVMVSETLDGITRNAIYSVANMDRQNSLSLMYANMSTTDKSRAKTYFDWHKRMLSKHYDLQTAIAGATTLDGLNALFDSLPTAFTDILATAPYDAVDLRSYIH